MSALKPTSRSASGRLPRVTFDTTHGGTADGIHTFFATPGDRGRRYALTSVSQDMVLERRVETTVFGRYIILLPGAKVTVKTVNADRGNKQTSALFNTPQWEATYQNIAWEHGVAPQVYGYDNEKRIIVMQPMKLTLEQHIKNAGVFSKEMQLKYLKVVHTLDNINVEHRDLRAKNFMLDATGAVHACNFERARHLTETVSATARRNMNVQTCLARFDVDFQSLNKKSGVADVITPLLQRLNRNQNYDIDAYIALLQESKNDKKTSTKSLFMA